MTDIYVGEDIIYNILSFFRLEDITETRVYLVNSDFYNAYKSNYLWYKFSKRMFLLPKKAKYDNDFDFFKYASERVANRTLDEEVEEEYFLDEDAWKRPLVRLHELLNIISLECDYGCCFCKFSKRGGEKKKNGICQGWPCRGCCKCVVDRPSTHYTKCCCKFITMCQYHSAAGSKEFYFDCRDDCIGCCFCSSKCKIGCCECKDVTNFDDRCGHCHVCLQFNHVYRLNVKHVKEMGQDVNTVFKKVKSNFLMNKFHLREYFDKNRIVKRVKNAFCLRTVKEKKIERCPVRKFEFILYSLRDFGSFLITVVMALRSKYNVRTYDHTRFRLLRIEVDGELFFRAVNNKVDVNGAVYHKMLFVNDELFNKVFPFDVFVRHLSDISHFSTQTYQPKFKTLDTMIPPQFHRGRHKRIAEWLSDVAQKVSRKEEWTKASDVEKDENFIMLDNICLQFDVL